MPNMDLSVEAVGTACPKLENWVKLHFLAVFALYGQQQILNELKFGLDACTSLGVGCSLP